MQGISIPILLFIIALFIAFLTILYTGSVLTANAKETGTYYAREEF